MKVLLTTDTVGGVWTYAMELSRALGRHGGQIALATMGEPLSRDQAVEASRLAHVSVFESRYKLEWMQEPWDDVRDAGRWLLDIERQFAPDLVHLNGFAHGALPWGVPVLVAAHSCVLSWWEAVKGCSAPASWDRYRREVTRGLRAADCVVAPSKAMLDSVLRHYGPLPDARVIYNGRTPDLFADRTCKEPFILTAGRLWDEAKNVQSLAAIAPELDWPAYVAGEEKHPDGGHARAGHVRMLGKLPAEELAGWFRRAAIYALPARYEPFGLTALEAGLAGCALVLADIPSLREIWSDAARFFPVNDPAALAESLRTTMNDEELRRHLGERARARALELDAESQVQRYLNLYHELIGRASCRAEGGAFSCAL